MVASGQAGLLNDRGLHARDIASTLGRTPERRDDWGHEKLLVLIDATDGMKDHVSWSEYGPNCLLGSEKSMGAHTSNNVQVSRALLDGLNTSSPAEKLWAQGLDSIRSLLLTEE